MKLKRGLAGSRAVILATLPSPSFCTCLARKPTRCAPRLWPTSCSRRTTDPPWVSANSTTAVITQCTVYTVV